MIAILEYNGLHTRDGHIDMKNNQRSGKTFISR